MEFFHKVTKYPFMHTRKVWYGVSGVAIIASIVLLFVHGLNLGIDFTGGVVLEFAYPQTANVERTRTALTDAGIRADRNAAASLARILGLFQRQPRRGRRPLHHCGRGAHCGAGSGDRAA